jgi:hypothetical protein
MGSRRERSNHVSGVSSKCGEVFPTLRDAFSRGTGFNAPREGSIGIEWAYRA